MTKGVLVSRWLGRVGVPLAACWVAACGGGGSGGASAGSSTSGRSEITTASGTAVSEAAHNYWKDGIDAYERAKKSGYGEQDCSQALEAFEKAASAQPKFAEAVYMQGLTKYHCGDPKAAVGLYEQALRINDKLCRARAGVGLAELQADNLPKAEQTFRLALNNDPQCTEAYVNLAIIQRRQGGANEEALNNLRRALAINAQYLPAFNEMALLYVSEAEDNIKKLDLAEVVCSQAQKIDANYAPVYNTWGLIDLRRDKIIEASAKFQKAFELDPTIFEAYMNFGQITLGFRGYSDAKTAFEKALELRPDSFEAQVGLGVALRGLEQNAEAIAAYEKAMSLQPSRPEPYYNLGVLWQDFQEGSESDMDKAEKYYKDFLNKAGGEKRFAEAVQDVTRKCDEKPRRRRKGSSKCIAGRLQNIANYRQALRDMEEMEELQKQAEAEAAALEAEEKAQQEATQESEGGEGESSEQPAEAGE